MERRFFQTEINMWGPIDKGNLTAKEDMSGLMAVFMKETLKAE